jgi:hypothetical protein
MQESGGDYFRGHPQVGENARHGETVVDVWLARVTFLLTVSFLCHTVGALNELSFGESIIFGELFQ